MRLWYCMPENATASRLSNFPELCGYVRPRQRLYYMEIQEQQKEGENLAPVEEVDMGVEVSCAEDLKQLCLTKAKILQLPIDATKCMITGEGVESAEVNKMSEFRVVTGLSNGKPTKQPRCHRMSFALASKGFHH